MEVDLIFFEMKDYSKANKATKFYNMLFNTMREIKPYYRFIVSSFTDNGFRLNEGILAF